MQWEYLVVISTHKGVVLDTGSAETLSNKLGEVLDELGARGWELVTAIPFKDDNQAQREKYILKRVLD